MEPWVWVVSGGYLGTAGFLFGVVKYLHSALWSGLQNRVTHLEEARKDDEARIRKLENYIIQLGHPVPNGNGD